MTSHSSGPLGQPAIPMRPTDDALADSPKDLGFESVERDSSFTPASAVTPSEQEVEQDEQEALRVARRAGESENAWSEVEEASETGERVEGSAETNRLRPAGERQRIGDAPGHLHDGQGTADEAARTRRLTSKADVTTEPPKESGSGRALPDTHESKEMH